jgi:ABC-type lipoprotein release transport system permease subunit
MQTALRFCLKDMVHDLSRTLLSIGGLAVVISSYFILSALAGVFTNLLKTTLVSRNLIVIQDDMIDPSDAVVEPQVLEAAQELLPETISRISPVVFRHIRVDGHVVQLRAADMADWEPVYHLALIQGSWPKGEREIVAGEGIAQANAWEVGTPVEIFGSLFKISGIFRAPGTAFASVWMPPQTFWGVFDTARTYQALFVQAAEGVDAETVRLSLQNDARLANHYAVYYEDHYTQRNIQSHIDLSSMMTVVSRIALLGVAFGIFNSTTLSTVERSRELGILLGVGFSHRTVRGFILLRALLLGGAAYGFGLAIAFLYIFFQQATEPIFILGAPFNLAITPAMAASGLLWVVGLAWLGAWLSTRNLLAARVLELVRAV